MVEFHGQIDEDKWNANIHVVPVVAMYHYVEKSWVLGSGFQFVFGHVFWLKIVPNKPVIPYPLIVQQKNTTNGGEPSFLTDFRQSFLGEKSTNKSCKVP